MLPVPNSGPGNLVDAGNFPRGFHHLPRRPISDWRGDALAAGLSAKAIVHIELNGARAREAERYDMGVRFRMELEGPHGTLWVLEDGRRGATGRLFEVDTQWLTSP